MVDLRSDVEKTTVRTAERTVRPATPTGRPVQLEDADIEPRQARGITELIRDLRDETSELLREEIALARTEMGEKAGRAVRNLAYLAAGGLVVFVGGWFLLAAAVQGQCVGLLEAGVDDEITAWLAPLIVRLGVAAVGYALVNQAIRSLRRERLYPDQTVASLTAASR